MCELLVGLPAVNVLGVEGERAHAVVVHIESRAPRPGCRTCGMPAWVKERPPVELVDQPCFRLSSPAGDQPLIPSRAARNGDGRPAARFHHRVTSWGFKSEPDRWRPYPQALTCGNVARSEGGLELSERW
jgi:hypothetical protein